MFIYLFYWLLYLFIYLYSIFYRDLLFLIKLWLLSLLLLLLLLLLLICYYCYYYLLVFFIITIIIIAPFHGITRIYFITGSFTFHLPIFFYGEGEGVGGEKVPQIAEDSSGINYGSIPLVSDRYWTSRTHPQPLPYFSPPAYRHKQVCARVPDSEEYKICPSPQGHDI